MTGSHSFELVDVRAFARLARTRGAKSILDNTYGVHFFQPFTTGEVDVSVQGTDRRACDWTKEPCVDG